MRYLILFILAFTTSSLYAQKQSYDGYEKKADSLLAKIKSGTATEDDKASLKQIAYGFQNYGQTLDESSHDYINSLKWVDKAINYFIGLDDMLSIANNRKFKGYLLGRLGRFPEAKAVIQNGIDLYKLNNKDNGVAVSQFDLARVFEFENKIDSAIYYCDLSFAYWKSDGNPGRIFNTQNMQINLLTKKGEFERAKAIQENSAKLDSIQKFHWLEIIDFYFVSAKLYTAVKEMNSADRYQKLYKLKIAELKKQNINARSYFDTSLK